MDVVVVLADGGINSTVAAARAIGSASVWMLFIDYGQPAAAAQRRAVEAIADQLDTSGCFVLDWPHVRRMESFRNPGSPFAEPAAHMADDAHGPMASNIPCLISAMLSTAVHFARRVGAGVVQTGASELADEIETESAPGKGTPDHRREFFYHFALMLEGLLPPKARVKLETPLIDLARDEIIKLGARFDSPLQLTYSCKVCSDAPCGECMGCLARVNAFSQAGLPDPAAATVNT